MFLSSRRMLYFIILYLRFRLQFNFVKKLIFLVICIFLGIWSKAPQLKLLHYFDAQPQSLRIKCDQHKLVIVRISKKLIFILNFFFNFCSKNVTETLKLKIFLKTNFLTVRVTWCNNFILRG